jgi:hypothetical protein
MLKPETYQPHGHLKLEVLARPDRDVPGNLIGKIASGRIMCTALWEGERQHAAAPARYTGRKATNPQPPPCMLTYVKYSLDVSDPGFQKTSSDLVMPGPKM